MMTRQDPYLVIYTHGCLSILQVYYAYDTMDNFSCTDPYLLSFLYVYYAYDTVGSLVMHGSLNYAYETVSPNHPARTHWP